MTTFRAVVFDLFGTLVPELPRADFYDSIREMASILGCEPDAFVEWWDRTSVIRQTGGYPGGIEENVRAICAAMGTTIDEAKISAALDRRAALYRAWFHPRPGALSTMRELKGRRFPIALISMCAPDAPAMWRASELAPFVDVEVFSSEVGLRKPDPAIYRFATDRLWVEPAACLYVGDGSYGELSGAAAVGMHAVLIRDPNEEPGSLLRPEVEEWAGDVIAGLSEVPGLLDGGGIT